MPRLSESRVRPAVRDGARRQSSRRHCRDRVVNRHLRGPACRIAREHYENFPVASRLVPRRPATARRRHLCLRPRRRRHRRRAGSRPPDERLALLDEWSAHLRQPPRDDVLRGAGRDARAVRSAARAFFDDLLSAFRQDVVTTRYETWDDVLRLLPPLGQPHRPARAAARRRADVPMPIACRMRSAPRCS